MLLIPMTLTTRAMLLANTARIAADPTPPGTNTKTGWWCHFTMKGRGGRALGSIVPMIPTILITHDVVVAVAMKLVVMMTIISMKYGFTITTDKTTMRI